MMSFDEPIKDNGLSRAVVAGLCHVCQGGHSEPSLAACGHSAATCPQHNSVDACWVHSPLDVWFWHLHYLLALNAKKVGHHCSRSSASENNAMILYDFVEVCFIPGLKSFSGINNEHY